MTAHGDRRQRPERSDGGTAADAVGSGDVATDTVRTNDVLTCYERRGSGPPVVFVHAAMMHRGMWRPQLDALSDEYTVVAYDVRGHGRTGGSDRDEYSVELFADDLRALVGALGLERPVVCGLSAGGCIAQSYAVRYPGNLSGLVLADTWTPAVLDWRDRVQMASLRGAILPVRCFGIARVQALQTWVHERFLRPGARGDYDAIARLQAEAPAMSSDEFARVVRAVTGYVRTDVDLESISVPTLVLYGEHTVGMVERHVPAFRTRIADVAVREVPGAGHACTLDDPAFFATAVREHAARTAPAAAD